MLTLEWLQELKKHFKKEYPIFLTDEEMIALMRPMPEWGSIEHKFKGAAIGVYYGIESKTIIFGEKNGSIF